MGAVIEKDASDKDKSNSKTCDLQHAASNQQNLDTVHKTALQWQVHIKTIITDAWTY